VTKSQELAKSPSSDKAIVRAFPRSIARSSKDIKRGEAVLLSRSGRAIARSRFALVVSGWRIAILGATITGAVLALSGAVIAGASLYVAGLIPLLVTRYRGDHKLIAIDMIARQGDLDEAQRRLDAAPELRRRSAVAYGWAAGSLASHRGDYASALTLWREVLPRSKGLHQEVMRLSISQALLLSGQYAEARREFQAARLPSSSDPVLTGQSLARVMFVLCDPSAERPSGDDLHDWARRALEYSHTGVELAALGWAFERSGDEDMACFLANEAAERMHYPYLATWWPALQQWLDARKAKVHGSSSTDEVE
jgi:hypothetical protein